MSRKFAAALAVTLSCVVGTSVLSGVQAQAPAAAAAAPTVHPGTKLNFAPVLGGSQLATSTTVGSGADLGYTYQYVTPQKMLIVVSVYDGGRRVPSGSDNPVILRQFSADFDNAEQMVRSGGYTNFERQAVASSCTYGAVTFRCAIYSAALPTGRLYSKLLLAGYNGNFLKIRIDWSQAAGHSASEAERVLEAFISALIR